MMTSAEEDKNMEDLKTSQNDLQKKTFSYKSYKIERLHLRYLHVLNLFVNLHI